MKRSIFLLTALLVAIFIYSPAFSGSKNLCDLEEDIGIFPFYLSAFWDFTQWVPTEAKHMTWTGGLKLGVSISTNCHPDGVLRKGNCVTDLIDRVEWEKESEYMKETYIVHEPLIWDDNSAEYSLWLGSRFQAVGEFKIRIFTKKGNYEGEFEIGEEMMDQLRPPDFNVMEVGWEEISFEVDQLIPEGHGIRIDVFDTDFMTTYLDNKSYYEEYTVEDPIALKYPDNDGVPYSGKWARIRTNHTTAWGWPRFDTESCEFVYDGASRNATYFTIPYPEPEP
jgi:hypothetical protein